MKRSLLLVGLSVMSITVLGEPSVTDVNKTAWKPDDLHLRTGIFLEGIPVDAPEDKLYPTAQNLHKLDEYLSLYGIRLEAKDLPRLERAYRKWGASDGVFNVPDWISKKDEWDGGKYRGGYQVTMRNEADELVPLSRRDITLNRTHARPYFRSVLLRRLSTLGRLCQLNDGVFVGTISAVKGVSEEEKAGLANGAVNPDRPPEIVFQVMTNMFGQIEGRSVTIPIVWVEGPGNAPTNGMRLLVFYAKGFKINENNIDRHYYFFDWEKPPAVPSAPPTIVRNNLSCVRILATPEEEKAYIEAVGGYVRLLMQEKRDPDKFYVFLRPLVNSPIWRIRQDAKEDLLWLWGELGPEHFDLKRVLDDPELDWDLGKDYVRYIAIPEREKRKAETQ